MNPYQIVLCRLPEWQRKKPHSSRPAVVLADLGDQVLVAPLSTKQQSPGSFIRINGPECGLKRDSNVVMTQRRLIDKVNTLPVGPCPSTLGNQINIWLGVHT